MLHTDKRRPPLPQALVRLTEGNNDLEATVHKVEATALSQATATTATEALLHQLSGLEDTAGSEGLHRTTP